MRRPRIGASPEELAALRVKDGSLHRLVGDTLVPYSEHDFILISLDARKFREDYRQLEFYQLWEQAKRHIIDGDLTAARRV